VLRRSDLAVVNYEGTFAPGGPSKCEHDFGEDRGHFRAFARTAIGAGADVVLGSGPHVLRGLELYRGRLIAYSLGNLTGWHNFNTNGAMLSLSALITVDLSPTGRFERGEIASLQLDGIGVPRRDPSVPARLPRPDAVHPARDGPRASRARRATRPLTAPLPGPSCFAGALEVVRSVPIGSAEVRREEKFSCSYVLSGSPM
jgi:hypothetical protein